jgi:plasmid stabilization system protein ParE
MARISYASRALTDLEAISDFLAEQGVDAQLEALDLIDVAIGILARPPSIGRPAEHAMRELVISHGRTGYVALYRHAIDSDAVFILVVRHRRAAGFQA